MELCLKSVQRAITTIDAEIIVVDNNSVDDSCKMVKELFPDVILIENEINHGFSKGYNIGVAEAQGEYICILNPDTVVAEDTFIKLLAFSADKKNMGIVGCKLINGSGGFLRESKRNVPYVKVALLKFLGNSKRYYASHIHPNGTEKVAILVGAFMLLKRDLYNEFDGFDEDYFMYGEDIDFSYRIVQAGYKNYYYGETSVIHFKGESTLKDKDYIKRFFGAMQIFYKKHFHKNTFFDSLVRWGIRIAFLTQKGPVVKKKVISRYVFMSNEMNEPLKRTLKHPIILSPNLESIENNDEIIFDANSISYKAIIAYMENQSEDKSLSYKILPHKSACIIGSNNAISRGEIIVINPF